MRRSTLFAGIVVFISCLVSTGHTRAQQVESFLDYFVSAPGTCMAERWGTGVNANGTPDFDVLGRRDTIRPDTRSCPGKEIYIHSSGSGEATWRQEIFYRVGGWIRLTAETRSWAGAIDSGRVFFRNGINDGVRISPDLYSGPIAWDEEPYADPWYRGINVCLTSNTPPPDYPSPLIPWQNGWWKEHWPGYLIDARNDPGGPTGYPHVYDIDVIRVAGKMGSAVEIYSYGKWVDPLDGRSHGLGLVGFISGRDPIAPFNSRAGVMLVDDSHYSRILVLCEPMTVCYRCPD